MRIVVPGSTEQLEIPEEWWAFAEMATFSRVGEFYVYSNPEADAVEVVPISEVEPPRRSAGVNPFKKFRLIPILMAFQSKESALPAIEVARISDGGDHKYSVSDGYHRYYSSIAAGFSHIPVMVRKRHAL